MSRKYKFREQGGLVFHPEEYVCSSARVYSGEKGILDDIVVLK